MIIAMQQTEFYKDVLNMNYNNSNLFSKSYVAFEIQMSGAGKKESTMKTEI